MLFNVNINRDSFPTDYKLKYKYKIYSNKNKNKITWSTEGENKQFQITKSPLTRHDILL
jgi:hypothetical protein